MALCIILSHKALCQNGQGYHLFFWTTVIILVSEDQNCAGRYVCFLFLHSPTPPFIDTAGTILLIGNKEITKNTYFEELTVELKKQKCL